MDSRPVIATLLEKQDLASLRCYLYVPEAYPYLLYTHRRPGAC